MTPGFAVVPVCRSGVDVAVAGLQRGLDRGNGLLRRGLIDPEAECRHGHAVVQSEVGDALSSTLGPCTATREGLLGQALAVPLFGDDCQDRQC
jgi:hypothetical protein